MNIFKSTPAILFYLAVTFNTEAGGSKGNWMNFPIFNQAPLEVKIGKFSNTPDPDLAVVVLWNDGDSNRLDAINIPPPYNGTGISSTFLEDTSTLFALGDICTVGSTVIVPYIKDFNVEVARFNGSSWSTSTIPGTTTNNFDNADCGTTQDGLFISTHDLTDGETEFFKSTNAGGSYTFYGRYPSSGPFDGALREPLATSHFDRYAWTLYQRSDGMIRAAGFSTVDNPPNFTHTDIESLPAPGGFTFVKESAGSYNGAGVTFTYNANGNATTVDIPQTDPFLFTIRNMGPVDNTGSQFSFQGSTLVSVIDEEGEPMASNVLWGDYFFIDPFTTSPPPGTDNNYPLAGVGGPVDGCVSRKSEGSINLFIEAFFAAPRVGSDGTDLYIRELDADPIFADGFESGDTSSWSMTCP